MTLSQDQASDSSHPDASFLAPGTKMSLAKNHPTNAPSKPLAHESGVTALLARLRNGNRNASLPPDPRLLELVNVEIKRLGSFPRGQTRKIRSGQRCLAKAACRKSSFAALG